MSISRLVMDVVLADMASTGIRGLSDRVKGLGAAGREASAQFERMGDHVAAALKGASVTREVKAALVDGGLEAASSLQAELLKVRMNLPLDVDADKAMADIRAEAEKLAVPLPFDTKGLVAAANELQKSGMSLQDITGGGLRAVGMAAALSDQSPAQTASQAAVLQSKFGATGAELPGLMDLASRSADASRADIGSIIGGLSQVSGAQGKLSAEEQMGILALASSKGIDGTSAGTSLTGILRALPMMEKRSGGRVQAYDASGQFVGLPALLEQLRTVSERLTPEKRDRMRQRLFGEDASTNALVEALLQRGALEKVMADTKGSRSLESKAAILAGGEAASWDAVRGSGESLLAAVYDPLLDPSTGLAGQMNAMLAQAQAAVKANPAIGQAVSGASVAATAAAGLYTVYQLGAAGKAGLGGLKALRGAAGQAATEQVGAEAAKLRGFMPVFVTNWPTTLTSGGGVAGAAAAAANSGGALGKAGALGTAAAAGWAAGSLIQDHLIKDKPAEKYVQGYIGQTLLSSPFALMASDETKQGWRDSANGIDMVRALRDALHLNVEMQVNVDQNGNASVVTDRAPDAVRIAGARSGVP